VSTKFNTCSLKIM